MAVKGYCTVAQVAAIAGELNAAQAARAAQLIEAAEVHLDTQIGRGWLVGAQTQEATYSPAHFVFLHYWPVASVATVYGRSGVDAVEATLTATTDYEVESLASGRIHILYPHLYDRIRVTYTPDDAVPANVSQACAELAAHWLQPTLRPGTYGLDSYSLPDLTVRFARSHIGTAVPPFVENVIDYYRTPVTA